jgi:hypothetical protein
MAHKLPLFLQNDLIEILVNCHLLKKNNFYNLQTEIMTQIDKKEHGLTRIIS